MFTGMQTHAIKRVGILYYARHISYRWSMLVQAGRNIPLWHSCLSSFQWKLNLGFVSSQKILITQNSIFRNRRPNTICFEHSGILKAEREIILYFFWIQSIASCLNKCFLRSSYMMRNVSDESQKHKWFGPWGSSSSGNNAYYCTARVGQECLKV